MEKLLLLSAIVNHNCHWRNHHYSLISANISSMLILYAKEMHSTAIVMMTWSLKLCSSFYHTKGIGTKIKIFKPKYVLLEVQ